MQDDIIFWIIVAAIAAVVIVAIVLYIVKFVKMSPEEKKATLIMYLSGLVAMAEEKLGTGKGAQKLEEVEKYFNEKAPMTYKLIMRLFGKEHLKDLIEEALSQVKKNFNGGK